MDRFEDLVSIKGRGSVLDDLQPAPSVADGPPEYAQFLRLVGFGALTDHSLNLYSGLVDPQEIYGPAWNGPALKLFGDNMAGLCFAFRAPDNSIVGIEADGRVGEVLARAFSGFLRSHLSE